MTKLIFFFFTALSARAEYVNEIPSGSKLVFKKDYVIRANRSRFVLDTRLKHSDLKADICWLNVGPASNSSRKIAAGEEITIEHSFESYPDRNSRYDGIVTRKVRSIEGLQIYCANRILQVMAVPAFNAMLDRSINAEVIIKAPDESVPQ